MVLGLLVHVPPTNFFSRILRSEALVDKSYFFRTAVLGKLFEIRFSYKHCDFSSVCLLVKMASKTVTKSISEELDIFDPSDLESSWDEIGDYLRRGRSEYFVEIRML